MLLRVCRLSPAVLLELPVTVVERADLTCLEPAGDAVEVEGVLYEHKLASSTIDDGEGSTYVADTPGDGALLRGRRSLVGLAVDAQVHDVVAADGAVVDDDVPGPECDGIPLQTVSKKTYLTRF